MKIRQAMSNTAEYESVQQHPSSRGNNKVGLWYQVQENSFHGSGMLKSYNRMQCIQSV